MIHQPKPHWDGKRWVCLACDMYMAPEGPEPPDGWEAWFRLRHDSRWNGR